MKWAYYVRHKVRAALVLTAIMLVILLSNFFERRGFSNLDDSMASIYNDRLMPAAYLYEISSSLYQKRLLYNDKNRGNTHAISAAIAKYNFSIHTLIAAYDATVLTNEESSQWASFKKNLQEYNRLEQAWLSGNNTETINHDIIQAFNSTITNLNKLNKIQVGEGSNLKKSSQSIVSSNLLLSTLEMSLLVILGLFTLVILSTTDRTLFKNRGNEALN